VLLTCYISFPNKFMSDVHGIKHINRKMFHFIPRHPAVTMEAADTVIGADFSICINQSNKPTTKHIYVVSYVDHELELHNDRD